MGQRSFRASPSEGGAITIQAGVSDDQYVQLTFRDTGRGISAAALKRVFEPFFSTKEDKGTGLGLAMCRQIVESHQGFIALDSIPDEGTTVTIELLQADASP